MNHKTFTKTVLLAALLSTVGGGASAGEREDLEQLRSTTLMLIQALVEQGLLSREKAAELVKKAETRSVPDNVPQATRVGPDGRPVVRVPYVSETVKGEIRAWLSGVQAKSPLPIKRA